LSPAESIKGGSGAPPVTGAARRDILVWSAFVIAFSPLLLDLFRHVLAHPWAGYGLLFAVILVTLACREPSRGPSHRDGYALLAAALVLQAVAVGGGFARWGRLAIPLGVMGLARLLGRPSPRVAALAFWAVPLPNFIAAAGSPLLERLWLEGAVMLLAPFATIVVEGTKATAPRGVLALDAVSGGLALAALLSGLGWVSALHAWRGVGSALRTASLWGLAALPLQALCVLVALALSVAGAPRAAQAWLSWGIFLASAAAGLAIAFRSGSPVRE